MTMQFIASQTVDAGGAASITFSNIPSTFTHLQIRLFAKTSRATYGDDYIWIRVNGDTGANYVSHQLQGDGSSATSAASSTSSNYMTVPYYGFAGGAGSSNVFGAGIFDILDYANTNKNKTFKLLGGIDINGTIAGYGGKAVLASGLWLSTSAISSISIGGGNANFVQYTRADLYGITTSELTGA